MMDLALLAVQAGVDILNIGVRKASCGLRLGLADVSPEVSGKSGPME